MPAFTERHINTTQTSHLHLIVEKAEQRHSNSTGMKKNVGRKANTANKLLESMTRWYFGFNIAKNQPSVLTLTFERELLGRQIMSLLYNMTPFPPFFHVGSIISDSAYGSK